jgi:hypothetical protein
LDPSGLPALARTVDGATCAIAVGLASRSKIATELFAPSATITDGVSPGSSAIVVTTAPAADPSDVPAEKRSAPPPAAQTTRGPCDDAVPPRKIVSPHASSCTLLPSANAEYEPPYSIRDENAGERKKQLKAVGELLG